MIITPRLRKTYRNMKSRCCDPRAKDYRFYGAKGITVCKQWLENPDSFYYWALDSGYTDSLTIDRLDTKKGYCPENCRWIDRFENAKVKSTTRMITVDGVTDSLSGWAIRLGIPKMTMVHRAVKKTDEEIIRIIKEIQGNKNEKQRII